MTENSDLARQKFWDTAKEQAEEESSIYCSFSKWFHQNVDYPSKERKFGSIKVKEGTWFSPAPLRTTFAIAIPILLCFSQCVCSIHWYHMCNYTHRKTHKATHSKEDTSCKMYVIYRTLYSFGWSGFVFSFYFIAFVTKKCAQKTFYFELRNNRTVTYWPAQVFPKVGTANK